MNLIREEVYEVFISRIYKNRDIRLPEVFECDKILGENHHKSKNMLVMELLNIVKRSNKESNEEYIAKIWCLLAGYGYLNIDDQFFISEYEESKQNQEKMRSRVVADLIKIKNKIDTGNGEYEAFVNNFCNMFADFERYLKETYENDINKKYNDFVSILEKVSGKIPIRKIAMQGKLNRLDYVRYLFKLLGFNFFSRDIRVNFFYKRNSLYSFIKDVKINGNECNIEPFFEIRDMAKDLDDVTYCIFYEKFWDGYRGWEDTHKTYDSIFEITFGNFGEFVSRLLSGVSQSIENIINLVTRQNRRTNNTTSDRTILIINRPDNGAKPKREINGYWKIIPCIIGIAYFIFFVVRKIFF